jgi:hypothetical protein
MKFSTTPLNNILISYDPNYNNNSSKIIAKKIGATKCTYTSNTNTPLKAYRDDKIDYTHLGLSFPHHLRKQLESNNDLIEKFRTYEHTAKELIRRNKDSLLTLNTATAIHITYSQILSFVDDLFKGNFDLVILTTTPHQNYDYFFYMFAKVNEIKTLFINNFYQLPGNAGLQFITSDDSILDDNHLKFYKNAQLNEQFLDELKDKEYLFKYLEFFSTSGDELIITDRVPTYHEYKTNYLKSLIIRAKNSLHHLRKPKFIPYLFRKTLFIIIRFARLSYYRHLGSSLIKHYQIITENEDEVYKKKFVYFPLHFQPEATTCPAGGIYFDQLLAIKELRKKLDDKILIYVKEHPAYLNKSNLASYGEYRTKKFYDEIQQIKGVLLVGFNIDSHYLIQQSFLTATVTGSVILESIKYNKYCIVFGNTILKELPNVIKSSDLNNNNIDELLISRSNGYFATKLKYFILMIDHYSTKVVDIEMLTNNAIRTYENYKTISIKTAENILDYLKNLT